MDEDYKGVVGIYYDMSRAFDLVDHDVLLKKLEFYGLRNNELSLFKSYISNRKQFVELNNSKSEVKSGEPQGSVLGLLLFLIYINDMMNLGLNGKIFMYADDISILYPYKYESAIKPYIERDAALLFEYAIINKLRVNSHKTKLIRFRPQPVQQFR